MSILSRGVRSCISFCYKSIKKYFKRLPTLLMVPNLDIEVTSVCNSSCVFCAHSIMKRPQQHLDMSLFKKAVDEFVAIKGTNINFCCTMGEPLLDPYLLERAGYVKQFPQLKELGFVTNMQWLHKFNMDEFFDFGITWLIISAAFSGRQKYFEFFGVDCYEQTFKNIVELIEENKKRKNKIRISFSIKPTNEPIDALMGHPDFKLVNILMDGALVGLLKYGLGSVDDWFGNVKLPAYLKKSPFYPKLFYPCKILYGNIIVFSNGKAGACPCRDFEANSELIVGNIRNDSLEELWNGEKIKRIRDNWRKRNIIPDICKHCRSYIF